MVHGLTKHYDVAFKRDRVRSLIISLISGTFGIGLCMGVASLFKALPVIGSLAGGATVSILSGAMTYAVGKVFIQHFELGGTLLNFNPKQMRKHFERELQVGKAVVRNIDDIYYQCTIEAKDLQTEPEKPEERQAIEISYRYTLEAHDLQIEEVIDLQIEPEEAIVNQTHEVPDQSVFKASKFEVEKIIDPDPEVSNPPIFTASHFKADPDTSDDSKTLDEPNPLLKFKNLASMTWGRINKQRSDKKM